MYLLGYTVSSPTLGGAPQGYSVHGSIPSIELAFNKYLLNKRLNEWCCLNGLRLPGGPVVTTALPLQGACVQSLAGELRSRMPPAAWQKIN